MSDTKKKRIYQVAKEFNISTEALIEFLHENKFKVRNHMAPLTPDMYDLACTHFQKVVDEAASESDFRRKLQEKKKEEEAHKQAIIQEIDEILELSKKTETDIYEKRKVVRKESVVKKHVTPKAKSAAKAATEEPEKIEPITAGEPKIIPVSDTVQSAPADEDKKKEEKHKRTLIRRPEKKKGDEDEDEIKHHKKFKGKERVVESEKDSEDEDPNKKKKRRRKKKKKPAVQIDAREIEASIKETLAKMGDSSKKRKRRKEKDIEEVEEVETKIIHTPEFCSVSELATLMNVDSSEVISVCISLGLMVSINQRLDKDTIIMVADEFDYDVDFQTEYGEDIDIVEEEEDEALLVSRPPVVTIMGHVDHGKTSLLDYIRESNIIAGEAGGITQHIGAYEVKFNGRQITFLDTPGHEAFTAMRARGAQATDIVILVVAADDSVMPQTIEAINHANAAGVPIVVAINKMDKPGANAEIIKKQLSNYNVLVEEWGGKAQCAAISAKTGQGMEELLELLLLEADILELKANPQGHASAVIIEAKMERGKGIVSTVLVQKGTLRIGDIFIAGQYNGRVRALFDERNNVVKQAPPSTPVQVLGFTGMPQAGDQLTVVSTEQEAREISTKRQQLRREHSFRQVRRLTLDQISKRIAEGEVKELSIILKADVDGSVEALSDSLMELANEDVAVRIIHKGVGAITESDVLLAEASAAVILGFNITPTSKARDLAQREEVDIRQYNVIYDVVNDVKLALSGLLEPDISEEIVGLVEIREVFKASKVGKIAGCHVQSGKITRNSLVRLSRDSKIVYEGSISTLKRFKDDVKEVAAGYECGITFENYTDVKPGDVIEVYKIVETARTLE